MWTHIGSPTCDVGYRKIHRWRNRSKSHQRGWKGEPTTELGGGYDIWWQMEARVGGSSGGGWFPERIMDEGRTTHRWMRHRGGWWCTNERWTQYAVHRWIVYPSKILTRIIGRALMIKVRISEEAGRVGRCRCRCGKGWKWRLTYARVDGWWCWMMLLDRSRSCGNKSQRKNRCRQLGMEMYLKEQPINRTIC